MFPILNTHASFDGKYTTYPRNNHSALITVYPWKPDHFWTGPKSKSSEDSDLQRRIDSKEFQGCPVFREFVFQRVRLSGVILYQKAVWRKNTNEITVLKFDLNKKNEVSKLLTKMDFYLVACIGEYSVTNSSSFFLLRN